MLRKASLVSVVFASLLAGCGGQGADTSAREARAGQAQACIDAVAAHVGLDADRVTAGAVRSLPGALSEVDVRDGDRLHTCLVDAEAGVREIRHQRQ